MAGRQSIWLALLLVVWLEAAHGQCNSGFAPDTGGDCSLIQKSSGGRFVFRTIYQDSPYPKECNNMTVFLKIDVPINIDTAITISGFKNASNCRDDNLVPIQTSTGANDVNFGSAGCGSGSTGFATWDPVNFAVVMYPSSVIAANTIMAFHFRLRNPAFGMESPQIHVSLDGAQVILPTPMWKHTRVTALTVNASARCFPADVYEQRTANPMIDIVPAMSANRTTYSAMLETKSRIDVSRNPPKHFFTECTGTTAKLSVDGVQSVNVKEAGCGCTGQFGEIVAGSAAGDGKFLAHFSIVYMCKGPDGNLTGNYTDLEDCATGCSGDEKICNGIVDTSSIKIIDRGYGYTTAPTLFIKEPKLDKTLNCDVMFSASILKGRGFAAYYDVTSGMVDVTNHGLDYEEGAAPLVSIHSGCKPNVNYSFVGMVGGYLRHPKAASVTKVDEVVSECLSAGTKLSCYSHDPVKSISIKNWTGTTTDCSSAITADMHPDKVTIPVASFCSKVDDHGLRSTWPLGKFADWSVYGDAAPLKVYDPMFIVRRISQETSEPGRLNTLTVSLVPSVRLGQGSNITISGLSNVIFEKGPVMIKTINGPSGVTARWMCKGSIVVTIGECTLFPGHLLEFSFRVLNNKPDLYQVGKPVYVSATAGMCANLTSSPDQQFIFPFQEIHDPTLDPATIRNQYGLDHDYWRTGTGIELTAGIDAREANAARGKYSSIGCLNASAGDLSIPTMMMFLGSQDTATTIRYADGTTSEKNSSTVSTWPTTVHVPAFLVHRVWQTHAYPRSVLSGATCGEKIVGRAAATAGLGGRVDNTLHFEFAVSVNVSRSSYFQINGLEGVVDTRVSGRIGSIPLNDDSPSKNLLANAFCNELAGYTVGFEATNTEEDRNELMQTQLCLGRTVGSAQWVNDKKILRVYPVGDIVNGRLIKFSIDVQKTLEKPLAGLKIQIALLARNSTNDPQEANDLTCKSDSMNWKGMHIDFQSMHYRMATPASGLSCPIYMFNQRIHETTPFFARVPEFLAARMRQQHPFPLEMALPGQGIKNDETDGLSAASMTNLNRQRRNWIQTKLVSNVPLNSNVKITLRNLLGRNFTEFSDSPHFSFDMTQGEFQVKMDIKSDPDGLQGQRIWPGQIYSFVFENRNHFPHEMMPGAARPAYAAGAETRRADTIEVEATGCVPIKPRKMDFDKPKDKRVCRSFPPTDEKYGNDYDWKNDRSCEDLEGCLSFDDFQPFRTLQPVFCIKKISQTNPLPGKENMITVQLTALFDMEIGQNITIAGLNGQTCAGEANGWPGVLPPTLGSFARALGTSVTKPMPDFDEVEASGSSTCFDRECDPNTPANSCRKSIITIGKQTDGTDWPVPSEASNIPPRSYWNYWAGQNLIFKWKVKNWNSTELALIRMTTRAAIRPYAPPTFGVQTTKYVTAQVALSGAESPAAAKCSPDYRAFSVHVPTICSCVAELSSNLPGAPANVSITFKTNIDFVNGLDVYESTNLTLSGLVSASTPSTCYTDGTGVASSPCNFVKDFPVHPGTQGDSSMVYHDLQFQEWSPTSLAGHTNLLLLRPKAGAAATLVYNETPAAMHFNVKLTNPVPTVSDWDSAVFSLSIPSMPGGNTQITCGKVTVEKKQFKFAKAGQLTPYPCAQNLISVTLVTNYVPDGGMYVLIDGLPLSVFSGGDDSTLNLTEVAEGFRTGTNQSLSLFTHPRTNARGQGLVIEDKDNAGKAHVWFKVPPKNKNSGDMQAMKEYIFSFPVKNPGSPFIPVPEMQVSAYGQSPLSLDSSKYKSLTVLNEFPFEYDKDTNALCKATSQTCLSQVYMPQPGEARPLFIREPKIISSFAGQSKPYPGAKNVITVSLRFNVHLYPPTKVQLSNFVGVKAPVQVGTDVSTGNEEKYDSTGFCPDILDSNSKDVQVAINAEGQQALSVTFPMKSGTNLSTSMDAATPLEIRVGVTNPIPSEATTGAQWEKPANLQATLTGCTDTPDSCCVTMARPQSLTYASTVEQMQALFKNPEADYLGGVTPLKGTVEAAPLYLRKPTFRTKQVSQEIPYPLARNTIYMNIGLNYPLVEGTKISVKGMTSKLSDIVFANALTDGYTLMCGSHQTCSVSRYLVPRFSGTCADPNPTQQCRELRMEMRVARRTSANLDYYLAFQIFNPRTPQAAPTIQISAESGNGAGTIRTSWHVMTNPDIRCGTCGTANDNYALFIRGISFGGSTSIRQSNPFSRGENDITLTMVSDGRLRAATKITIAGFREWDQGQVELMEVENSGGFAKDFGIKSTANDCSLTNPLRCTDLSSDTGLVSADDGIVYGKISSGGAGCIPAALTDAGDSTRLGSGLKIDFKVDCGSVTHIKIQATGSGYTGTSGPLTGTSGPFGTGDYWTTTASCTTAPTVVWYRSHDLLEKQFGFPKYDDARHELVLKIKDNVETHECVTLAFKFTVFNPIVAKDTNPAPIFPLNLTMAAEVEVEGSQEPIKVPPISIPIEPNRVTGLDVCNDATNCDLQNIPRKTGDAVPMRIYVPEFLVANVGQSMPYPGAFNEISVTLQTNVDLFETESIIITFNHGGTAEPEAPSLLGYANDLRPRAIEVYPFMSGRSLAPTYTQDVLTTSRTPSPSAESGTTNGYVNISGFTPAYVIETALTQPTSVPEIFYYYGDYIECCNTVPCHTASYREVFKVLAYSRFTKRLRLRRSTPLQTIRRCFVFKTVYIEDDLTSPGSNITSVVSNSAEWNKTSSGPALNLTIQDDKIFRGGHEYRFKFTVRNPTPDMPYVRDKYKGVDSVNIRVDSRDATMSGLVKQRLEYALGVRANLFMTVSSASVSARTRTADGQSFAGITLATGITHETDYFKISVPEEIGDVTRELGPGLQVMINTEVMTVIHALHNSAGNFLKVKRHVNSIGHAGNSTVLAVLPGFKAGDAIPFRVQQKAAVLTYMRQSTALPGASNRLITSLVFNYPVNAMDKLSITGLKGFTLKSSKIGDTCSAWMSSFQEHCPTATRRQGNETDTLFQYFPNVLSNPTKADSGAINGKSMDVDLGSYGKVYRVPLLSANSTNGNFTTTNFISTNFTTESIFLPVNDQVDWSNPLSRPCVANSVMRAFDRFDYDGNGLLSLGEWRDYAQAYQDTPDSPLTPLSKVGFVEYLWKKYNSEPEVTGIAEFMSLNEYYTFTRFFGVMHSLGQMKYFVNTSNTSIIQNSVTKEQFIARFGPETPDGNCPAFRPGDFVVVAPTDTDDDEEVLLVTEVARGSFSKSASYNTYRGQLYNNQVPDHQPAYDMYALYEHGADGGVFSGERFPRSATSVHAGVNLVPAGQLLSFTLDVFNPGSSSSPWETNGQASGTVQWKINGKNLQKDGTTGKLKLEPMTLNDTFALEETLSSTTEPDGSTLLGVGIMDAGDLKPTVVYKSGLLGKKIVQGNPCPNAPINPITITLVPSVPIPAFQKDQTSIVFSNFHGAVFQDGAYVSMSGSGAENIGYSGRWRSKDSSVTVNISKELHAGKQYVFMFNVTNPEVNQSGSKITVHTTGVIQSIVLPYNKTNACGCADGTYIFKAEDGYQGSGFEARLTVVNGHITSKELKSGGYGYNSTPPVKMTHYVGEELNVDVDTNRQQCIDAYTCGRCLSTSCNLGADQNRRMILANIEGIEAVTNVTIWCTSSQTDAAVTLDVSAGGFGSGFAGTFTTSQDGIYHVTKTITVRNPGAGYMYIPYSVNNETMAGCECTKSGEPNHPTDTSRTHMCRCQGPTLVLPSGCATSLYTLAPNPTKVGAAWTNTSCNENSTSTACSSVPQFQMAGGRLFPASFADHGKNGDQMPMYVKPQSFEAHKIGQESPWPEALNTITVTLSSCVVFSERATITLTGFDNATNPFSSGTGQFRPNFEDFCDSVDAVGCPFRGTSSPAAVPTSVWTDGNKDASTGPITRTYFTFQTKQVWAANAPVVFSFKIKNPRVIAPDYHPPPPIYISVSLTSTPNGEKYINDTLMQVDPLTVWGGIKGGRVPLAVWSDTWPTCFKNPVEMGTIDLAWRTTPQTYPREPFNRYDVEKMLWQAQDYPVPLHFLAIPCPNRTAPAPFDNRTCPPNGIVPVLHVKYVHQSNCNTNSRNNITVTLSSNVPLAKKCQHPCLSASKITLKGIRGYSAEWAAGTLDPVKYAWAATLPDVPIYDLDASGAAGPSGLFGGSAKFEPVRDGAIVFEIQGCNVMIPGKNYSLTFTILNGPTVQESPPDIHFEVSGTGIYSGYETGVSVTPGDNTGRHLGAACYEAGDAGAQGRCYNIRLATSVYIDKPKGVPDGGHQPLLIVHPGDFHNFKLYFGSCRTDKAQYACGKEPDVSKLGASSFETERDAELIIDFTLGSDINKGNYTSIRSKRYIWLKFPITIQPTGDKIQFEVEGLSAGSKLQLHPYKGKANCSDGQHIGEDPPTGADKADYSCRNFDQPSRSKFTPSDKKPTHWKMLIIMDPEDGYKADGTGAASLGYSDLDRGYKTFTETTFSNIRIRLSGLKYAREGVSTVNSRPVFQYYSLADDCRDGVVKNSIGRETNDVSKWWIDMPTFDKPDGVGSVYPTSVDYWQMQASTTGGLAKRMRVLDYNGEFGVANARKPWKKQRLYSTVQLKFTVNNVWKVDEKLDFILGDATQSIKCKEGASMTVSDSALGSSGGGSWKVTWNGVRAGVTRVGQDIAKPGLSEIQQYSEIALEMAPDPFECFLPANGLNPDSTISAQMGLNEALSLGTFKVSFLDVDSNPTGRALLGLIDTRHPVYKFQCLSQNIKTINADYCTGTFPVRMCATRDQDVSAYVVSKNYGNAKGFSRLIEGNPNGVPVYNSNVILTDAKGLTVAQQMKARCDALHNSACRFNDNPVALAGAFSSVTLRPDMLQDVAIQSLCCAHSPETRERDEFGLGNLASCIDDSDCDDAPAGVSAIMGSVLVAGTDEVCCDYCYEFYGSIACTNAQMLRPGIVDGTGTSDANLPQYQPYVIEYCKNTIQCTDWTPCKGYALGGKGTTIPKTITEPITVSTLNGDGIIIAPGDLDPSYAGMSLTVTEVLNPPALPPGMQLAGTVLALGPPGVKFLTPVPLSIGLKSVTATNPGESTASAGNATNSTRRVMGLDASGKDNGQQKVINFKYVAGINPNNGDPAPEWMPVTATEQASTVNALGQTVQTAKCLISGFSIYAPLSNVNYPNMGLDGATPGTKVGPYGQTTTSAGKEIYIGFAVFGVLLMLMYYIILLPSWAVEPPPPKPPKPPPAPIPEQPKRKVRPHPALPMSKPMYVQAEPVRFHHGTPIKHFGPTFDDIFDKDDLNWWAQEQAKAEYNFPKLPFDPKADAQLGYKDK